MRYIIKQKIISIKDNYLIEDESGNIVFTIRRQIISVFKKWFINDAQQNNLALIKNKVFTIMPQYEIFLNDGIYAKVRKRFKLFGHAFDIESDAGNYIMKGNFLSHEFEVYKGDKVVANVSKKWIAWADTYGVEIDDNENKILLLAIIIIIDTCIHKDSR